MSKEHLTYFKVENFKRFDSLELTDIGQFNLIVGDNNVGKTSLLEAISVIGEKDIMVAKMGYILKRRNIDLNQNAELFFRFLARDENKPIYFDFKVNGEYYHADFKQAKSQGPNYIEFISAKAPRGTVISSGPNFSTLFDLHRNYSLVGSNLVFDENLAREYQEVLNNSMSNKKLIINNLKFINENIVDIEVLPIQGKQHVMVGFESMDLIMPLTGLGESAVRVFYYLLHIIRNKGKFLMLDEIDTGIHYSRMKGFLKNIVKLADQNKVQLFLTTHSLECQQTFAEIFEDEDMIQHQSKARQFTLLESEHGQVVAIKRDWEQLEFALQTDNETRGGKWP